MRKLLFILCLAGMVNAVTPFTYYWTINTTGDTATVTKWKANNDSILAFATRVTDTINGGVPRWKGFSNHDSTFKWMNIDTLPSVDTAFIKNLKATKLDNVGIGTNASTTIKANIYGTGLTGTLLNIGQGGFGGADNTVGGSNTAYGLLCNPSVTVSGNMSANAGYFKACVTGSSYTVANLRSLFVEIPSKNGSITVTNAYGIQVESPTDGVNNASIYSAGKVLIGQATGTQMLEVTGNSVITGNVTADSFCVTKKIKSAGINSSGDVAGTTGTYSSTVSVDSLFSTKGIKGTRFTGAVTGTVTGTADSAIGAFRLTGGAVSATTGVFSSTLTGDSITSTKRIKATTGAFTNLTDGYIPYHVSDASGLANGLIYTDGTNIGIGTTTIPSTFNIIIPYTATDVSPRSVLSLKSNEAVSPSGLDIYVTGHATDQGLRGVTLQTNGATSAGFIQLQPYGGKVSIGKLTADEALDVTGNIKASGTGLFGGTVSVDSLFSTKGIKASSFTGTVATAGTSGSIVCSLYTNNNTVYKTSGAGTYKINNKTITITTPMTLVDTLVTTNYNSTRIHFQAGIFTTSLIQWLPIPIYNNGTYEMGLIEASTGTLTTPATAGFTDGYGGLGLKTTITFQID